MKFRVEWSDDAMANLGRLYLAASDKRRFTEIANEFDRHLEQTPIAVGRQLVGNRRVLLLVPLMATYDVFLDDRLVEVLSIKSMTPEA